MVEFDWEQFVEESTRIAACNTMPEVQEYGCVMQRIYENYVNPTAASEESD